MKSEMCLDGLWDFEFFEHEKWNAVNPEAIRYPEKIMVPGCFDAMPGFENKKGTGVFRRFISCGGNIKLDFEATGINGTVLWDGETVGVLDMPYTPFSFTFFAGEKGLHELIVMTDNIITAADDSIFSPFYDFHPFGGIYHSVKLRELPERYIDHVEVIPQDLKTGKVLVKAELKGMDTESVEVCFDTGSGTEKFPVEQGKCEFYCNVPDFKIWSPENPELHTLTLSIPGDSYSVEFGLRTIECKDGKILLNGEPLRLVGWNRHESYPAFGAAVPELLTYTDLQMIKRQGCNFVRGSHYKQSDAMLRICDRLGLLVWEESLGWGNRAEQLANPAFRDFQKRQTLAMVRSSINHPCVIMWGFLNECASDTEAGRECIAELCKVVKEADPSRPVTFASCRMEKDIALDLVDIIAFNTYPGWYDYSEEETEGLPRVAVKLKELAEFASREEYRSKPFIIGEIGAAAIIGDHSGGPWSEEYQADLLEIAVRSVFSNPRYSGLTMWLFANAKTYNHTWGSVLRPRGYNNKGAVDEFRRPKLSWTRITEVLRELRESSGK